MKFKVGDKVRAKVDGQVREGVVKEIDSDSKPYLVYFDGWTGGHNGDSLCKGKYEGYHCLWFRDDELELVKRGEKDIKKSDLKSGAIVETRNNDKYILLLDCSNIRDKNVFIRLSDGAYLKFENYNENLNDCGDKDYDIMKVCQHEYVGDNICSHILKQNGNDWTWVRKEETVMTISEIEEKLGISNLKIKKED